jgi:putative transposase
MSKRRTHSPEFKARVAMEAISGRKKLQEIAGDHALRVILVSEWMKLSLEGANSPVSHSKFTWRSAWVEYVSLVDSLGSLRCGSSPLLIDSEKLRLRTVWQRGNPDD